MTDGGATALARPAERAAAIAAQGLGQAAADDLEELVARTGFVRTLGGADAYLALRARLPGLTRADVDAAIARGAIRVVPAVRGCMFLVAERHVALALHVAESHSRTRSARELEKVGVDDAELGEVETAIVEVLGARGALTAQGLRKALPPGVVRSLGDAGKRVGLSSTLPPALRRLEFTGRAERAPEADRVDHERYLWRVPDSNPLERGSRPADDDEAHRAIAELFFRAAGVGTLADFTAWSGLGARAAQAAVAGLGLTPVELEDARPPAYAHPGLLEDDARLDAARSAIALLPCHDNLVALRGGPARLVDEAWHDLKVPVWGRGRGDTLGSAAHAFARTVVAGGRVVGLWEFDPDAERTALRLFDDDGLDRPSIEAAADDTAEFLATELGHGRAMVNDTVDSLRERLAYVRTSG